MALLEVEHLVKRFGAINVVNDVSFNVDPGEILVIVGASGCGKTTTLRCIAGLEDVTDGAIRLDGQVISARSLSVPPERRGIGMVFQSYALWPHKTVFQNISYGLERREKSRRAIRDAVSQALEQVGLSDFADRYPSTLSGGQQQRVALARCAAMSPKLLLLDEPLSNLDAKLRERMREELRDMIKMIGMTAVHITHDQGEAMALADKLICLREGRIEQMGSPRQVYRNPQTRFVADFVGACSFFDGHIVERTPDGAYAVVEISSALRLRARAPAVELTGPATVSIRPEGWQIVETPASDDLIKGTVTKAVFLGPYTEYSVDVGGVSVKAHSTLDLHVGARCLLRIDPDQASCLRR